MNNDMSLFKTAILYWVYQTLNNEFPLYFNKSSYINLDGQKVVDSPNVYWGDTVRDRPLDATECCLDIINDEAVNFGTDGEFYQDTDNKWYYRLKEYHEITVNFSITSMKNKKINLTALQAQNLSYNACSYLRMLLKSGSASDYFCYENDYLKNILVCSQNSNLSEITDTSIFEDTKSRHTCQFSCKFRYDQVSRREIDLAQKIYGIVIPDGKQDLAQSFDIDLINE